MTHPASAAPRPPLPNRSLPAGLALPGLMVLAMCAAAPVALAQAAAVDADTVVAAPEPGDVRGAARAAQARFELRRVRHLPRVLGSSHGPCDETVGRFCTWYEEGEWAPEPEAPEITTMRDALLAELDALQAHLPGDGWILGQRVWYRVEGGDREGALALTGACGPPQEAWWCAALTGFALHGLGRYVEAERAFDRALHAMDLERAWEWRVPEMTVDGDVRGALEDLRAAPADSVERVLDRLWRFADPLLLIPGNDRKTEHLARWTVATLRDGARNPYRISWGSDLEELVVRHGWELGWERSVDTRFLTARDGVTGHKHPEGRDYMPPGTALLEPGAVGPEHLQAGHISPRSLYAPPYAPVLLPMDGQVARFPRGQRMVVVATHHLPEDTTYHADHDHPRPWMEPGDQVSLSDRAGAYLVDLATGETRSSLAEDRTEGALLVEAGPGLHLLSVEAWSPPLRRAGRHRAVLEHVPAPDDVPVLSDLLLLEAREADAADLESAVEAALIRPVVEPRTPLALAWEVSGLGFRSEALAFELSVTRTDRGLISRLGGLLGLGERPRALTLAWQEEGPERPGRGIPPRRSGAARPGPRPVRDPARHADPRARAPGAHHLLRGAGPMRFPCLCGAPREHETGPESDHSGAGRDAAGRSWGPAPEKRAGRPSSYAASAPARRASPPPFPR